MSRVLLAVLSTLSLAVLGSPWRSAAAEPLYPNAGTPTQWFLSLDRNQDGFLDRSELRLRPAWAQALAAADKNHDLRIDHSEFLSLLDRMQARR